jgi:oligoendopeptidase F
VPVVFVLAGSAVLAGLVARFFYYNFYVYQYATGIASAVAIVDRIRDEGESAAADYREALRLGGSEYPVDVLAHAGVDVTRADYMEIALNTYGDLLDEAGSMVHD